MVQIESQDLHQFPAMSMISYAAGARFINLLGGEMLSFMIGMLIYRLRHHKFGVNKLTYLNQVIGTMLHILLCGFKRTTYTYT